MRLAIVYYKEQLAGTIKETDEGYEFEYDKTYLNKSTSKPVSLTLPLKEGCYQSKILFPFFDGLIPEGWLLHIATTNWKLNTKDRFSLLLTLCKDCIGAVSVTENK